MLGLVQRGQSELQNDLRSFLTTMQLIPRNASGMCAECAGTLNHKYTGENAVRAATPHYCVVRSTGLTTEEQDTGFLLDASQGDRISGKISRAEVASVIVAALHTPAATGQALTLWRTHAYAKNLRLWRLTRQRRMLVPCT